MLHQQQLMPLNGSPHDSIIQINKNAASCSLAFNAEPGECTSARIG